MIKQIILVALVTIAAANLCDDGTGSWSSSLDDGVTDFAYGGVALNNNYNCFEGCLNTQTAVQDFKVALNGSAPPTTSTLMVKERRLGSRAERMARLTKMQADGDDPNAELCVDPILRADVANALGKVTDNSCKGIVKAILFNLNRPGWAVNCVDFTEFGFAGFYQDYNFCQYETVIGNGIYTMRMAKIDIS